MLCEFGGRKNLRERDLGANGAEGPKGGCKRRVCEGLAKEDRTHTHTHTHIYIYTYAYTYTYT